MKYLLHILPFKDQLLSDHTLKELLRNSSIMYVAGGLSISLTFLQQITTANLIGVEDYGRLAAIVSSNMLVMLLIDFRTWEAATKLLARSFAEKDYYESASTITWLSLVDLGSGFFAAVVMVALAVPIATHMLNSPPLADLVTVYVAFLPLRLYVRGVPNTLIRLYGRFDWLSTKSILYALIRLIFMSGLAWLGFGLTGVVLGAVISDVLHAMIMHGMMTMLWRRNTGQISLIRLKRPKRYKEGLRLLRDLWIGASIKGLQLETFIPILALLTSPTQIGLYRMGLDIAQLVTRLTEPLAIVVQPTLIQLFEEQPLWKFVRYIKQITLITLVIVIPFMLGIVLLGPLVLPLVLAEEYADVPLVANLLIIGFGYSAIMSWLRPAILALEAVWLQNITGFVSLVVSMASLFLLAPRFGAVGAAITMSGFLLLAISLAFCIFYVKLQERQAISP